MTRPRGLRRQAKVLLGVATLVACVAAGAGYLYVHYLDVVRYSAAQGRVTVERAQLGRLGTVLVTNRGFALYAFPPDAARNVTCTGDCASAWPPLKLHAGDTVAAGAGVRADLLGTVQDPGGGRVVTYHGWPLYTYLGDASPGHAAGQGADDDGGYWYVMRPSGQMVNPSRSQPAATSAHGVMVHGATAGRPFQDHGPDSLRHRRASGRFGPDSVRQLGSA